ncbi:MgtC/SapB family protein [Catenulispora pinisilvae]|uniref:MgtC/SapB family protein n=1 Tax=Catenulispora pinisilvae TaxID=2705253 RepID=UPI001891298C|nr:MgtC/SapB family protein [Catenulispora pinisilvae]
MQNLTTWEFIARLAVGLGCGAAIGVERQMRARMAGLRTNALVAVGATLFVLYSDVNGSENSTQVAAYVVSGIGFLGGGVILRDGFNVRGLNTAATLWCSAAVGVMAASGHLAFAMIGTVTVLLVHLFGRPAGRLFDRDNPAEEDEDLQPYRLHLTCRPKSESHIRALLVADTTGGDVYLRGLDTTRADTQDATSLTAHLLLDGEATSRLEQLVARLSLEPGIHTVHWHKDDPEVEALTHAPKTDSDD